MAPFGTSPGRKKILEGWAEESHELAKTFAYSDAVLQAVRATPSGEKVEPITFSDEYLKQARHQARLRIIAAGLRLS